MILCVAAESDYLPGLAALDYSIKRNGNIPDRVKRVLISSTIAGFEGWTVVKPRIEDYAGIPNGVQRWKPQYAKARWKLDALILDSDVTVLLDADTLCLGDISELFAPAHEIMAALDNGIGPSKRLNSGVLSLSGPNRKEIREELIQIMRRGGSFDGADQGAYQSYVATHPDAWGQLDQKYNVLKRLYRAPWASDLWDSLKDDIRILHFVGRKPWIAPETGYKHLEDLWHTYHAREV